MTGVDFPYSQYRYQPKTGDSFERKTATQPNFTGESKTDEKSLNQVKIEVEEIKDTFQSFTNAVKNIDELTKPHPKQENAAETVMTGALSMIPGLRRVTPIEDNAEHDNKVKVAGLAALALINTKEDMRDIYGMLGRVKTNAHEGYCGKFGFFTGTILEKWLKKSEKGTAFIKKFDKTLGDFKIVKKLLRRIGVKKGEKIFKKRILHFQFKNVKSFILDKAKHPRIRTVLQKLKNKHGEDSGIVKAMRYVQNKCSKNLLKTETVQRNFVHYSGPKIGRLIGHTLDRIPVISLGIAALLELPTIITAIKEKDDKKQITRSAITLGLSISTGALLSAAGAMASAAPVIGPALSILGLGIGAYLGNKAAKEINSHI